MLVLNGSQLLVDYEETKKARVGKRILQYDQKNDNLMFKDLVVPKPNEHCQLILDLHQEIGHFEEGKTLVEFNKHYFWHNKTQEVKDVV